MSFQQNQLARTVEQAQGIYDKYIYRPTNGDSIATMSAAGYFDDSRYVDDEYWLNSVMEIDTGTDYYFCRIMPSGLHILIDGEGGNYNPIAPDGWIYNPTNQGTYEAPVKGDWRSKVQIDTEDPEVTRLTQERLSGFDEWQVLQSLGGSVTSDGFIISDSTEGFAYGADITTLINVGPSMGGALLGNEFADSAVRMKKGFAGSKEDPNITVLDSQPLNDELLTLPFNPDRNFYEHTFTVMEDVSCLEESVYITFEKEQDFTDATFRTGNRLMDGNDSVANCTMSQFGSGKGQVPIPGRNEVKWLRQYPVEAGVGHIGFIQSTKPLIILGSTIDGQFIPAFSRDVHIIEPLWHTAFPYFKSGTNYTKGQWLTAGQEAYPIETKLYKCLVSGVQTGTLESNTEKWQLISDAEYLKPLRESQLDANTAKIGEVFTVTDVDSATNPNKGYADGRWTFGGEDLALITVNDWSEDSITADPESTDWFNLLRNEAWSKNRLQYKPSTGTFRAWYLRDGTSTTYSFSKTVSAEARDAFNAGGVEFKFNYGLDDNNYPRFDITIDGETASFTGNSSYTYTVPSLGAIAGTTMNNVQGYDLTGDRLVNSEGSYIETAVFTGCAFERVSLGGNTPIDIGGILIGDISQKGLYFLTPDEKNFVIPQVEYLSEGEMGVPFFWTGQGIEDTYFDLYTESTDEIVNCSPKSGYNISYTGTDDFLITAVQVQPADVMLNIPFRVLVQTTTGEGGASFSEYGEMTTVGETLTLPLIESVKVDKQEGSLTHCINFAFERKNTSDDVNLKGGRNDRFWIVLTSGSPETKENLATEAAITPIAALTVELGNSESPVTKDDVLVTGTIGEGTYRGELGFNIHSPDGKWVSWVNMGLWLDDVPLGPIATGMPDTTQADKYANASGVRYFTVPSGGGEYKVTMNCSSENNAARFGVYAYLTKIS